ncbi:hypothetical protein CAEBREN_16757 [Caenorhabditis brenneri]|uniref:SET domain-containing protein n=1 Tax=Caenorhabditis brenneri TaxID=135651 RepID=G0N4H7_CAEBE|nr:hypothetical protein CAEBREN_16757 [Caenorhabditis brenneri]
MTDHPIAPPSLPSVLPPYLLCGIVSFNSHTSSSGPLDRRPVYCVVVFYRLPNFYKMSNRPKRLQSVKQRNDQRALSNRARTPRSAPRATTPLRNRLRNAIRRPRPVALIGNPDESSESDSDGEAFPYPSDFEATPRTPNLAMVVVGQITGFFWSILYIMNIICRPSALSHEARRGHRNGSTILPGTGYPGIPQKKYNKNDISKVVERKKFQVQAYYEKENAWSLWSVLFEGWDCSTLEEYPYRKCKEMQTCQLRSKFLNVLLKVFVPELGENIKKCRYLCDDFVNDATHKFWIYEDLSYFHSMIQHEKQMAEVFYFCFLNNMRNPPKYHYSAVNVVEEKALERCRQKEANKTFAELNGGNVWIAGSNNGPCEQPGTCKCDARFNKLYDTATNLQPKSDGTLDMNYVKINERKIVVECTEECGCSSKCPRRRLQQGQLKALAAVYQDKKKGFGLRAVQPFKEGEFICEYTGYAFFAADKTKNFLEKKQTSYEADFKVMDKELIIDSLHIGNISRFMNHHCNPNACFIETESREFSSQPLIPRIAVYARRDIAIGEEITLCYYDLTSKKKKDPNGIDCGCGATRCIGKLPIRK